MHHSIATLAALADHQPSAVAAEQLGGQQIFFLGFRPGRGVLILLHPLLHPFKQFFGNDGRHRIRDDHVLVVVLADVLPIFQHGVEAAVPEGIVAAGANAPLV